VPSNIMGPEHMTFTDNLAIFLLTVVTISTTGVMMPGPVTAATIAKGYKDRWAGVWIALGHAVVEFPTIALMAIGFSIYLNNIWVAIVIGLAGGSMLVYMGLAMIGSRSGVVAKLRDGDKEKGVPDRKDDPFPYHPFVAGAITTASNPYYFLWWATLGAALTLNALEFGLAVLVVFAVLHWSIDLVWDFFIGYAVNRSRRFWDRKVYLTIFAICGAIMVLFGIWFVASAVTMAMGS